MAIVKYIPQPEIWQSTLHKSDLEIKNWRVLVHGINRKHHGVHITMPSFNSFFIYDITIEEIHELNYCNKTVSKPFEFFNNKIMCGECNGEGTIYWIDAIMKKNNRTTIFNQQYSKYKRYAMGEVLVLNVNHEPSYVSTPYKGDGQEYCKHCCGTGVRFVKESLVKERIHLEYS